MKRKFLNILALSSVLTTIGFLMDGDAKDPSMAMRFIEFIAMNGILFTLMASVYFASSFVYQNIQKA
ncbi:hypothetical protein [Flavobacterium cerinum]|uniref:Uncharacterized protein n=1 Tax=Flavobacterium cerinum TaxID=2502784 RepID=A0ABY5IWF0_9FLAO|nr:hypothetical protein [Flavobacterium cerinum]UUC47157.1 hypothetical protein NOX80_08150 [Flavobacterium cerinum]